MNGILMYFLWGGLWFMVGWQLRGIETRRFFSKYLRNETLEMMADDIDRAGGGGGRD